MSEFRMPSLGADMEDAKLVEWLAQPGDKLKRGDVIAVVETQKGAIEVEVFEDGVLAEHLVAPGAILPVGAAMARIEGAGEPASTAPAASGAPVVARQPVQPEQAVKPIPQPAAKRPRASPAARRLAQERSVDLTSITGTGLEGAITYADVVAHADHPPVPKVAAFDFTAMRRAIAAAMARSKREIPHYYLSHSFDVSAATDWLAARNEKRPPAERILLGALLVKAVAKAARAFPEFNGFFTDNEYRPSAAIHVGVAIAIRGGGLAAPAIHDAADLGLDALMAAMRDLVGRVRAGRFRSSEIADPTITVTSLGDRGVDAVWGVIYPPQVAIIGFGKVAVRPWVIDGSVSARPVLSATLAADHRVSDGHRGALFLEKIAQLLTEPTAL